MSKETCAVIHNTVDLAGFPSTRYYFFRTKRSFRVGFYCEDNNDEMPDENRYILDKLEVDYDPDHMDSVEFVVWYESEIQEI